jgi:hypothetical protein
MKSILIAIALVLTSTVISAESTSLIAVQTIEVGERPLWREVVRGTARVVTMGAVQAAADTIKQAQPFSFAFDHDGLDTDVYQVFVNGAAIATIPVSQLVNGSYSHAFPQGLPKGTYVLTAKAFGPGGEGASDPLSLSVTAGNPSAPRNPRIVK